MIAIADKQETIQELQYTPHLSLRLFHESSEPHRAIVGQVGAPGQSEIDFPQFLGGIERLRERRRLVDNIKDLFGHEPKIAVGLKNLLERPGGIEELRKIFPSDPE